MTAFAPTSARPAVSESVPEMLAEATSILPTGSCAHSSAPDVESSSPASNGAAVVEDPTEYGMLL